MKWILCPLVAVIASAFYFPFELNAIPGFNSKMLLAVIGLLFCINALVRKEAFSVPGPLLALLAMAGAVSLASLFSITLHQTPDTTYVGYVVSFSVWLSSAYAVCSLIRIVHGTLGVRLITNYLAAISLFHCFFALAIDNNPLLKSTIDGIFATQNEMLEEFDRIYSIGVFLDVAGARFSAVLIALSFYLSSKSHSISWSTRTLYFIIFLVITVIGNMIARTTLIGVGIGLVLFVAGMFQERVDKWLSKRVVSLLLLAIVISVCVYKYNSNDRSKELLRFGFEGFFSLVEKGEWDVQSNNKLKSMVVFPETLHTWIIGDGYFLNSRYDENYLGDSTEKGYYMGTDIGYLRFIFYFGLAGLLPMLALIVYSAILCMKFFRHERAVFILSLVAGLLIWFKVSTDIFCFFSLFLSAAAIRIQQINRYKNICN